MLALLAAALSFKLLPWLATAFFLFVDFLTPIDIMSTSLFETYHKTAMLFLTEKSALPLPEITFEGENAISWENVDEELKRVSKNFRFPVVLRNAGYIDPKYQDEQFWKDNYGEEDVICAPVERKSVEGANDSDSISKSFCTIRHFLEAEKSKELYVAGASSIFLRRPELDGLMKTRNDKPFIASERVAKQMFMGWGGAGSETHAAIGTNVFHMIKGRKRWVFFPPSQTPYIRPSMNNNPFSAMTSTVAQNPESGISPWVNKLERYEVTLEPGDVLLNPSWFWHSVYNLGSKDELVIGCPMRHNDAFSAVANNPLFTIFSFAWMNIKVGGKSGFLKAFHDMDKDGRDGFERMLAENRMLR